VDRALDRRDRNRQDLGSDAHHERVGYRDGQRQADPEPRAAARLGLHLDLAAKAAHVRAYDVHADAAACRRRHRRRRGETRQEDQVEDVALAQARQGLGADEAAAPCRLGDRVHVDAAAVVSHLDVDRAALVSGAEVDRPLRRLAGGPPRLLGLDAVGDRVAHEMDQRIGHQLDDRGVHLDRLAADLEHDALARRPRAVANHAHEGREQAADRHHARAGDLTPQLTAEPLHTAGILAYDSHQPGQLVLDLREVARDLAHPSSEQVEVVVAVELELVEEFT
jgi:hypothetical protein